MVGWPYRSATAAADTEPVRCTATSASSRLTSIMSMIVPEEFYWTDRCARLDTERVDIDLDAVRRAAEIVAAELPPTPLVAHPLLDRAVGRPVLVKLSPDLDAEARSTLVRGVAAAGGAGVIVSNTSTERAGLRAARASEVGGLSGAPLRARALRAVAEARAAAGDGVLVIGSGGVASAADARALLDAGADLVQLWTGMIYEGPGLIGEAVTAC